jgi:hypothetical protein
MKAVQTTLRMSIKLNCRSTWQPTGILNFLNHDGKGKLFETSYCGSFTRREWGDCNCTSLAYMGPMTTVARNWQSCTYTSCNIKYLTEIIIIIIFLVSYRWKFTQGCISIYTLFIYKNTDSCLLMSWRSLGTMNCNMHSGWYRAVRVRVEA